jgi:hypothetical protein
LRLSTSAAESLHDGLMLFVGRPLLGIAGFHYFTFNRLLDTWRWEQGRSRRDTVDSRNPKEVTWR